MNALLNGGVTAMSDSITMLSAVLREAGAEPRVVSGRVVRSTLYDLDYHLAIVSCAVMINGEESLGGDRSINAHWLKVLQFVAARPSLVADFGRWARARRHKSVDTWQQMPRGYLGDRTHDRTVELLVAGDVLRREGEELEGGARFSVLAGLYGHIQAEDLLTTEREALDELRAFRVNKTLLRGR